MNNDREKMRYTLTGADLKPLYEMGMAEFLRSKGFIPGGDIVIDGVVWTADEIAAHSQADVDWGTCAAPDG